MGKVVDFLAERAKRQPTFGDMRLKIGGDIIGYQIGGADGYTLHGDPDDTFGFTVYEVFMQDAVDYIRENYPNAIIVPIYADDVEQPVFIGSEGVKRIMALRDEA